MSIATLSAAVSASLAAGADSVPPLLAMEPMAGGPLKVLLVTSALLFSIGLIGFLSRRNMIMMFLCTELMLQAAALAFVAFGRMHLDYSGQTFVIFILTIAAAEAALALALVVLLFRRRETLNSEAWSELHE